MIAHTQDNTDIDEMILFNSPSGNNVRITVRDSAGAMAINAQVIGAFSFVQGQQYEILFQYNSSTGEIWVYIDGTLLTGSPVVFAPWSRGTGSGRVYVGANVGTYNKCEAKFTDILTFTDIQETDPTYTTGYSVSDDIYLQNTVVCPDFVYSGIESIQSYLSLVASIVGNVLFSVNGQYWTGATWSSSDGTPSQGSNQTDITNNLSSFPTVIDTVTIRIIFSNSSTQMSISNLDFGYNGVAYPPYARIDSNIVAGIDQLLSFISAIPSQPANTNVLFSINAGGVDYWYNTGSLAWEVASGDETEANTDAEINSNAATFPFGDGKNTFVKTFLITTDDQVTPEIQTLTYQFSFSVPSGTFPTPIQLYGTIFKLDGQRAANSTLYIEYESAGVTDPFFADDAIIRPSRLIIPTDANGEIDQEVIPTISYGRKYKFTLEYTLAGETDKSQEFWGYAEIVNSPQVNIASLTFTEEAA
jgi:hypothetical protein